MVLEADFMDQSFSSLPSPGLKRKRSNTTIMTHLRTEAARVVRKRLGLHVEPNKVAITGKPFPKRKTVYIWKVHGDLSESEQSLVSRTINSESTQRRYFRSWSDLERVQLTALIKKEAILPEYYDRKGGRADLQSAAWELLPSDTEEDEDEEDEEGDEEQCAEDETPAGYRSKDAYDQNIQLRSSKKDRPTKRSKEMPTNGDSRNTPEALIQDLIASTSEPQPVVKSTVLQTPSTIKVAKRCSLQAPESVRGSTQSVPQDVANDDDEALTITTPTAPPRTMSLNSNGVLELDPVPTPIIPSPIVPSFKMPSFTASSPTASSPTFPITAPIAASPFTPTVSAAGLFAACSGAGSDSGDETRHNMIRVGVADMENTMRAYLEHATVAYLSVPRFWEEKRALKREHKEKENQYEQRLGSLKKELEQQVKLSSDKESMFKGIITSLEAESARCIKDKMDLDRENKALQEKVDMVTTLGDRMQHQISTLEKDLASSKASEKQLQLQETATKDCYKRLGVEHDKLKEATDLKARESQQKIDALEKSQSELECQLEASVEAHKSKEDAFQDQILALELKLGIAAAEKEALHRRLMEFETGSLNLLQNVMSYQSRALENMRTDPMLPID
ncbi:hypothetical protein TWF718_006816 [Orbilia javanica]|uniref:Uncharacterized protein n=1 Tax=Orbilia javanica TaxID=47235 RepID=A0AAN8N1S5_9PEZI